MCYRVVHSKIQMIYVIYPEHMSMRIMNGSIPEQSEKTRFRWSIRSEYTFTMHITIDSTSGMEFLAPFRGLIAHNAHLLCSSIRDNCKISK